MRPILTIALTSLPLTAIAETPPDGTTLHYLCERGARVEATYLARGEEPLVVVAFEGRQMAFQQYDTTAGIRYLSFDKSHVWWDFKGEGSLIWAGEGEEVTIYRQCLPQ